MRDKGLETEQIVQIGNHDGVRALFGRHDENMRTLEEILEVKVSHQRDGVKVKGSPEAVSKASQILEVLMERIDQGEEVSRQDVHYYCKQGIPPDGSGGNSLSVGASLKGRVVAPKTKGQRGYVEAIRTYDIVFGIGPAGTGKTYLAMAMAVEALKQGKVRRIILTRPALEAGESLGYLPGDMYEKISPYLRPLYDALYDMMEAERIEKYLEMGIIEVAPLAYMRGRTLNDAFIILDEAQNCTPEQMKMFLTRLGFDSKAVITGDITQSDLPGGKPIGLLQAKDLLEGIEGIGFSWFSGEDVVRHELVQKIIEAYDRQEKRESGQN
jgi:phosphate starvation-inducible PhoH-like protein